MKIKLDFLKKIPPKQRYLIIGLAVLAVGYAYFYFLFQPVYEKKSELDKKLSELGQQIAVKQQIANEIQKGKKEISLLKSNLELALTKLPDQKEIPSLLAAISESGKDQGLDFLLFEPAPPVQKEFYMEIPVKITVIGNFHNTVMFFEKIAKLSRIVNIADINMMNSKTRGEHAQLSTSCIIQTYMFNEKAAPSEKTDKKKK
ncbi:MAG: type 4a pilus biogenesis protein PilO [Syntrophaceae bacterium]